MKTNALFLLCLLGFFSPLKAGTWTVQPWTGDASSGIVNGETQWAYRFGTGADATINGVAIPVVTTTNANIADKVAFSSFPEIIGFDDSNNLTALGGTGSALMATRFTYGGVPKQTVTVRSQSLTVGQTYIMSFFSVGWDGDAGAPRQAKFILGADELSVNQNMFGGNNGLRVDYAFTATGGDMTFDIAVDNAFNRTLHLYAVALKRLAVALTSNNNPSLPGASVTFTATVTPVSGGGTPTGSVVFKDGTTTLNTATLNASGVATFTTSALSEGSHSITATYGGSGFDMVSAPLTQVVSKMNTATALISSANPALPGVSVTFTATVSPISGGGTATGSVVFRDGAATLATLPLTGGVATYTTSALTAGLHSITASYGGSGLYNTSVSNVVNQSIAGTLTVTTTASSGAGSLAQAITDASPGSFVVFQASLAGQVLTLPASEIIVDKDLTIDASALTGGVVLQGDGTNRLFYIPVTRTVVFKNLTLAGGGGVGAANTLRGGAVLNAGSFTAMDCVFRDNKATHGAGVASGYSTQNTSLTVQRCLFSGNAATNGFGGALMSVCLNGITSTALVEDSTFISNSASGGGGAIYNSGSSGTVNMTLRQCTITGNSASSTEGGGGVLNYATVATGTANMTVTHCTLVKNTTLTRGGGVSQVSVTGGTASITLTSNIIAENTAALGPDVRLTQGTGTSLGTNLIGNVTDSGITWLGTDLTGTSGVPLEARVASVGYYGGPTPTCPPLPAFARQPGAGCGSDACRIHRPARSAACGGCGWHWRCAGRHRRGGVEICPGGCGDG